MSEPARPLAGAPGPAHDLCTIADIGYLSRALTLHDSLRRSCPGARLFVLCIDESTASILRALERPDLAVISAHDFEAAEPDMRRLRLERSRREYCCGSKPSLLLHILSAYPEVDVLTLVDADMFFFGDAKAIVDELGDGSILLTEHGYERGDPRLTEFGAFNTGVLTVRRSDTALACLQWWRDRCVEWCFDRREDGRFLDQQHVSEFPARFPGVRICHHSGVNVAHWNVSQHLEGAEIVSAPLLRTVHRRSETLYAGDYPLICYHFCGVRVLSPLFFSTHTHRQPTRIRRALQRDVYFPYLRELQVWNGRLAGSIPHGEKRSSMGGLIHLAGRGGIVFVRPPFEGELYLPRAHRLATAIHKALAPLRRAG